MKTRFTFLITVLCFYTFSVSQTHITIDNPDTWSAEALRSYVGQTVIFDVPMVVCTNANGNYTVSPWRRFQPESHGFPGSQDYNQTVRINNSCMFSLSNVPSPTSAMDEPSHRCGEKIYNLKAYVNSTKSLTWQGGNWSGNTRADLKASLPELGDYRLLVCGFNLENYFKTVGEMGAQNETERQYQRTKVSSALKQINADIFGLVELQQGDEAIKEIVADLNSNLPARNYKYLHDATTGTMQKVDFVYDANTVEPVGTPVETNVELSYRKKMLCFREKATGEKFIYSINHFKSMNTGGADRRANEAKAVVKLYNSYRQNSNIREKDVLIMGDMNCYAFTDPIQVFINRGMIDLHRAFHADSSYSYMFNNMASYIDHAISNETLYRQITGMSGYHINSDEDDKYTYDKSTRDLTMFRCSDHDPVLVGLKLDSTLSQSFDPYINNAEYDAENLSFYYVYTSATEDPVVYFDIYSINGIPICKPTRIIYEGDIFEKHTKYYTLSSHNPNLPADLKSLLPLPSGIYVLHFYNKGTITSHKLIVK